MVKCVVAGCPNYISRREELSCFRFYVFPKEEQRFLEWKRVAGVKSAVKTSHRICSEHFDEDAFILQDRLLQVPKLSRRLIDTAVPTLKLPKMIGESKRSVRMKSRKRAALIAESMNQYDENIIVQKHEEFKNNFKDSSTQTSSFRDSGSERSLNLLELKLKRAQRSVQKYKNLATELEVRLQKFELLFTPEQVNKIVNGERVCWKDEDISSA